MSYIQGTNVELFAEFRDHAGALAYPAEAIVTLLGPDGTTIHGSRSDGDVLLDPDRVGRVTYLLDTTALAPGTWVYQFASTGAEAVVGRKELTIRASLPVAG